ncbi:MAG: putative Ig domain-containing protein [Acidimicrobiia bacterium]|nr:putative Ig domain-containing protein [Acidimicrobiia bacterium]
MPADVPNPARLWRRRLHIAFVVAVVATTCALIGTAPEVQAAIETYGDDFATYDYAGSTGTQPWASDWSEDEGDGPTAGAARVRDEPHCATNPCLVIGRGGPDLVTVERGVDLSGAAAAQITFDYKVHVHGVGEGEVQFRASGDGGGNWDTLATYDLSFDTATEVESISLNDYLTGNARIRFELVNGEDDSHLNVDNLLITADTTPPADIVFSEIDHRGDEFFELYNAGSVPVDINGYLVRLSDGVTNVTIDQGGGPVIMVPGAHYLVTTAGTGLDGIADQTMPDGLTSDTGFRVFDTFGRLLDTVGLGTSSHNEGGATLPSMPSGGITQSYERLNTGGLGNCTDTDDNRADFVHNFGFNNPQSMADPPVPCGSPVAADHVVISEFRPRGPNGADDEFVEIFNPTGAPVDISGWKFHITEPGLYRDFHIVPEGVILDPGRYYLLSDGDGPTPNNAQPFDVPTSYASSWGDVVLKDDGNVVIDVFGYGDTGNGQMYEDTAQLSYEGGNDDRSYARRHGGLTDTDNNRYDFVYAFDATPMWSNLAPVFDQDLDDRTDAEGALVTIGASATDANPGDTLSYSATGLPDGIRIDPESGKIAGALSSGSQGVYTVVVTVVDDGVPNEADTDAFTWTVTPGEVTYLIPGDGGADGGNDLLTAVDLTDLDPATNEVNIGEGTGTWSIAAAAVEHATGQLFAADSSRLGRIDTTTGRFSPVGGAFGVGDGAFGLVDLDDVSGIAFDPLTGDLYAVHEQFGASLFFQVDPATGAVVPGVFAGDDYAVVPDVGFSAAYVTDLAFDPTSQKLYGVMTDYFGQWYLVTIDPSSGASTMIGATGSGIRGLSFTADGELWGVGSSFVSNLQRIDISDGSTSDSRTVDNGGSYEAAAFTAPLLLNSPPVFGQDLQDRSDAEGAVVSIPSPATDPDVGDELSYSAVGLPPGVSIDPASGLISGTIDLLAGSGSPYAVTVTVADDGIPVEHADDGFVWTVTDVNRPPVLDAIADPSGDEKTPITFTATGSDPDLDGLTFSLSGEPAGAAIDPGSGDFTWTPAETQDGLYVFDVVLADDGIPVMTDSQTITVTVGETNEPPSLADPGPQSNGEGDLVNLTVTATDPDDPANSLGFGAVGLPPGLSIDPGSGVISGTVGALAAAGSPYSVTLTVTDDGTPVMQDQLVLVWTITDTNRSPTLDPIVDLSGDEGTLFTFTATGSDPDFDGLSFTLAGEPTGAVITPGGLFSWTPAEGQDGVHSFDVVLSDDGLPPLTDTQTVTVTVDEVNLAPTLDPITDPSGDELTSITFTATASDPDLAANTLTFSLVGEPPGATIDAGGAFSWTPTEAQDGTYTFDVVVVDDGTPALADSQTITVTVNEVNLPPSVAAPADQADDEGATVAVSIGGSDPDDPADVLTFSALGLPPGLSVDPASGLISGTVDPTAAAGSPYVVTVGVRDDGVPTLQDVASFTWTISDVNRPPILDPIGALGPIVGDELTLISFTATGSDPDLDGVTFSLSGAPTGADIDPGTGVFTWTPTEAQDGVYDFDVTITDDGSPSLATTTSVTVTVNETNVPPAIGATPDRANAEGESVLVAISAVDTDDPANTLTFAATGLPPGLSIAPSGLISGTIDYAAAASSPYTVVLTVRDDGTPVGTDIAAFTWTVAETNRPPVLDPIVDQVTDEDVEVTFTATASDPDGDPYSFSLLHEPVGASIDPDTGNFRWTPSETQQGAHTFKVVVTDAGSPPLDDKQYITITVGEVNEAPSLEVPDDRTDHEGDSIALPVPASDPDTPADTLTWSARNLPPGLTIESTTGIISGTLSYEASMNSPYTVSVKVVDGRGGECEHTFIWEVKNTNRAPIVDPIATRRIDPGDVVSFTASATDPDGDSVAFGLAAGPPSGATIDLASGAFVWPSSAAAVPGPYTFIVTATDDAGAVGSTSVTILVNTPNSAPVAGDLSVVIDEDTATVILLDAIDADGDELAWEITSSPTLGVLVGEGPRPTYRPRADEFGTDTIEFRVIDPAGASASGRVTITIRPVNDPPIAQGERYEMVANDPLVVAAPGLLANDDDIDDTRLTVALDVAPTSGVLEMSADGAFTYRAEAGETEDVEFWYRVIDASGAVGRARVVIAVSAPPAVSSPERRSAVETLTEFSWDEGTSSIVVGNGEESARETVERTLVLMTRASGVAVQQMGFPFILLLAAGFAVVSLGRLRVIPLLGRRRRATGVVQTYSADHGFGLVRADGEGNDLFVHRSSLRIRDRDRLRPGDRVKFRIVDGEHRDVATRLRVVSD